MPVQKLNIRINNDEQGQNTNHVGPNETPILYEKSQHLKRPPHEISGNIKKRPERCA